MTTHSELREILRRVAKHPKKVDRLTDEQLVGVFVHMAQGVVAASVALETVCREMNKVATQARRSLSTPELE